MRLRALGPEAASLLPAVRELEHEFELRARRIAALTSAGQITAALVVDNAGEPTTVADHVLSAARVLCSAERGVLALCGDRKAGTGAGTPDEADDGAGERDGLQLLALHDGVRPTSAGAEAALWARARTLMGRALREGELLQAPELRPADDRSGLLVAAFRSVMVAPLQLQGRPVGVVYLERRGSHGGFTEADLDTLRLYARQAAVALGLTLGLTEPRSSPPAPLRP